MVINDRETRLPYAGADGSRHAGVTMHSAEIPLHYREICEAVEGRSSHPKVIAERILQWLAVVVPNAEFVILGVSEDLKWGEIIAASNVLSWNGSRDKFAIKNMSPIRKILELAPESCASITTGIDRAALPWTPAFSKDLTTTSWLALSQVDERAVLLAFAARDDAERTVNGIVALKSLLINLGARRPDRAIDPSLVAAISRAKNEWERTVDALSEIVLLIDRSGRIVRANRAVERLGVDKVEAACGASLHDVIHFECKRDDCRVSSLLTRCVKRLRDKTTVKLDLRDPESDKVLDLTFQRIGSEKDATEIAESRRAVVVIADVTELYRVRQRLEQMNVDLEDRVARRTRELDRSNRELQSEMARRAVADDALTKSRDELARLSELLLRAQEIERRNLSMELHDGLGQQFGALKYQLERAIELQDRGERAAVVTILHRSVQEMQSVINDTRSIATSLHPAALDNLGLAAAVQLFCRRFNESYQNLDVDLSCNIGDIPVPKDLALHAFRIVQESLNNVAKHARAESVRVSLQMREQMLSLTIEDDGRGFDPAAETEFGHFGIAGMRKRASITGGSFSLKSLPGWGAQVRVSWKLSRKKTKRS